MSNSQQSIEPPWQVLCPLVGAFVEKEIFSYDPNPDTIVNETPPFVLTPAAPVILSWAGESNSNLDDAGIPGGTTRLDGEPPG